MRALILAAGFGTRLKELGEKTPKGLIKQHNKPLLKHVCQEIEALGQNIQTTALVTNNKYFSQYSAWTHANYPRIQVLNNGVDSSEKRLGAIGDLHRVVDSLNWRDEPLLVLPSDTYFEFNLSDLVEIYEKTHDFVTVVRLMPDKKIIANRLGCAVVEQDRITKFLEKPSTPPSLYAAIPFYLYPEKVLKQIPDYMDQGNDPDSPGSIIPWLIANNIPVRTIITTNQTLDVGTQEDITALQQL